MQNNRTRENTERLGVSTHSMLAGYHDFKEIMLYDSNEEGDKLNLRTLIKISPFLLLLSIQLSMGWFAFQYFGGAKYKAMELAKNPNNLQYGCVFYKNNIKHLIIEINNYSSDYQDFKIKNTPFAQKSKLFAEYLIASKDSSQCYKVKYVTVKIFFSNRYFIYDVEFPK